MIIGICHVCKREENTFQIKEKDYISQHFKDQLQLYADNACPGSFQETFVIVKDTSKDG